MFTISSESHPAYLRVVVGGPASVDEACAGSVFCAELMRRKTPKRVLLDMADFRPTFVRMDGLDILSTIYAGMPQLERLAVVIPAVGSQGLVLEVARHRNVPAREFADREEARSWLEEPPSP